MTKIFPWEPVSPRPTDLPMRLSCPITSRACATVIPLYRGESSVILRPLAT